MFALVLVPLLLNYKFTTLFLVLPLLLIYFYLKRVNQHWEKKKVPFVKPLPLVGNVGKLVLRKQCQADLIQKIYNSHDSRYIGVYSFLQPVLLIKDVNLLKQIAIKDFDNFVDHQQILFDKADPLFGQNLFSVEGEKWRTLRATVSPVFTGSKMRSMYILMSECAEQFMQYLSENIKPNETLTVELKDLFARFGSDIIATTAFGIQCNSFKEKNNEFYQMGNNINTFGFLKNLKLFGIQNVPKLMHFFNIQLFPEDLRHYFRDIILNNIKTREEKGIIRPDLIHLLMEARKGKLKHEKKGEDDETGFATIEESNVGQTRAGHEILTDDAVCSQAIIFFLAGLDTVSTALCHTVYELAINEDLQRKLQEEIDETLEKCGGTVKYENILKMQYLDKVVSEGLRKWPPVPTVDRACTKTFTIEPEKPGEVPVTLQKGDAIWIPMFGLHRDPKLFPNPEKFDPERFNEENKGKIIPHSYVPFGIGPRSCIASRFALLEVKTLLVYLFSKFNFVMTEKSEVPLKISTRQFSMDAANGFWLGMTLRQK